MALNRITGWAIERDFKLDDLSILRPTLEDVYLELTEHAATAEKEIPPEAEPRARSRR